MALTICTSSILRSSCAHRRSSSTIFSFSNSVIFCSKTPKSCLSTSIRGLGISSFQPWIGLRHMGISIRQNYVQKEGEGRCRRGKVVYASLFGVGAPEALVIGVVALLVFGPKGLAEVARNLGKTLRAFQPTIRELQEVSREFKNTLEREIGLDEVPPSMQSSTRSTSATSSQPTSDLNGAPSTSKPYSTEEYLKTTEEQLAYAAQKQAPSQEGQSQGETSQQEGAPPEAGQPLNIGEFLVQTQLRSSASSQPEETLLQEEQSETQPQPQATAPETNPKIPLPEKTESEA